MMSFVRSTERPLCIDDDGTACIKTFSRSEPLPVDRSAIIHVNEVGKLDSALQFFVYACILYQCHTRHGADNVVHDVLLLLWAQAPFYGGCATHSPSRCSARASLALGSSRGKGIDWAGRADSGRLCGSNSAREARQAFSSKNASAVASGQDENG